MPLSFDGAGIITGLQVGGLPDGTVDQDTLAAGVPNSIASSALPSGSFLRVVQSFKSNAQAAGTGATFTDVTALSGVITPSSANNKILVFASVTMGTDQDRSLYCRLVRNADVIAVGDTAGSRVSTTVSRYYGTAGMDNAIGSDSLMFLDSPNTTSELNYRIQLALNNTGTWYVNRREVDSDTGAYTRTTSSITLVEVAG